MQPVDNLIISGSSDNVNSPFIGPPAHPATLSGVCVIVGLYTLKKVRFQYVPVMPTRGGNVCFRKNRTFLTGRDYDRNAAKSDISSRFKRRVEDHRRSKGRLALLSRPVTRQEVADHRNAAIVGGVVGYPPGFHNDIDYLAPLIL
jgi:hypothetical protein